MFEINILLNEKLKIFNHKLVKEKLSMAFFQWTIPIFRGFARTGWKMLAVLIALWVADAASAQSGETSPAVTGQAVPNPGILKSNSENPWRILAAHDLNYAYNTLRDNHPGVVDQANQQFRRWLEKGYQQGLANLNSVDSFAGLRFLLQRYGSGFLDGHLFIDPKVENKFYHWPQFLLTKVGDRYIVEADQDSSRLINGLELISCDGIGVASLIKGRVFPYHYGNSQLDGDWYKLAPKLFVDFYNPWLKRLDHCVVKDKRGRNQTVDLDWQRVSSRTLDAKLINAAFGPVPSLGIYPSKELVWVSLPSFNTAKVKSHDLKLIVSNIAKYRDKRIVVFDVRGNSGGNSRWGADLLEKFYGKTFSKAIYAADISQKSQVKWRVSSGNRKYLSALLPELAKEFGGESRVYRTFAGVSEAMDESLRRGETGLLSQATYQVAKPVEKPVQASSPVSAKVYFLTDGHCASACLDFADRIRLFPGRHPYRLTDWSRYFLHGSTVG